MRGGPGACVARRAPWFEIRSPSTPAAPSPQTTVTAPPSTSKADGSRRRVKALVALRLLEVMRDMDLPPELLEEENTTVTLPRRLGLSDVVGRQIRSFREDARRGVRLADGEVHDLFRLVIRRPDAEEIFFKVGEMLAGDPGGRWRRVLPRKVALALARTRVKRRLRALFGRRVGGFGRGSFCIEGRALLFIEADPGGEACAFMSGLCKTAVERAAGRPARVAHTLCQSRGDALCRWEADLEEGPAPSAPAPARDGEGP